MPFCKVSDKAQLEHLEVESWKSEDSEEEDVVVNDWLTMMQMKRPHCHPSRTKESKNLKQQLQLGGQPPVKEMSVMKEYAPIELIDVTARFQQEAGEDIQAWGVHLWDKGMMARGRVIEQHHHTLCPQAVPIWCWEEHMVQITHSL